MRLIVVVFLPHSFHCLVRLRVGHVWSRCSSTMLGFCATIQISLLPIPIFLELDCISYFSLSL